MIIYFESFHPPFKSCSFSSFPHIPWPLELLFFCANFPFPSLDSAYLSCTLTSSLLASSSSMWPPWRIHARTRPLYAAGSARGCLRPLFSGVREEINRVPCIRSRALRSLCLPWKADVTSVSRLTGVQLPDWQKKPTTTQLKCSFLHTGESFLPSCLCNIQHTADVLQCFSTLLRNTYVLCP